MSKKSHSTGNPTRLWLEMHILGWVGFVLVIWGYYLNAEMSPNCWIVWGMGNLFIGKYCFDKKAYAAAVMSLVLIFLNIYGYFSWLGN